jgi:hypothetical protein
LYYYYYYYLHLRMEVDIAAMNRPLQCHDFYCPCRAYQYRLYIAWTLYVATYRIIRLLAPK